MNDNSRSIILVTVDCLRADHVGFMGYKRANTPFLDVLAGESLVVPHAIVAGAPTYYSLPGIMASRYPMALGRDILGLAPDEPTLTTALKDSGYATAGFSAANPYISSRFGYDRGFDVFEDFLKSDPRSLPAEPTRSDRGLASRLNQGIQRLRPSLGGLGAAYDELYFRYCQRVTPVADSLDGLRSFPSADLVVDQACRWLDSVGPSPFFLWLHLMDPHSPYYPKEEALRLMNEAPVSPRDARYLNSYWNRGDVGPGRLAGIQDRIIRLYDAGIRWVDEQVCRMVAYLKGNGRWDDCIFVLTADHGEEFLERGGRYHPPSGLMEELIHVPLLLRAPGKVKTGICGDPFSLIHLAPTLLDAANVPIPSEFVGSSAWSTPRNRSDQSSFAISECVAGCTNPFHPQSRMGSRILSIREQPFKLVLYFESGREFFFDLEGDPGENRPLPPGEQKPARRRLLEIARAHLERSAQRNIKARVQARLRELQLEWNNPAQKSLPVAS